MRPERVRGEQIHWGFSQLRPQFPPRLAGSGAHSRPSAEREASNKALKERESEIRDLTAQKAALEQKARELEQQVTAANQLASEAQARAEAQAEPVPFAAPQQAGSGAAPAYFANCTAAREAGAAPVYAGDPGYGRHLDRDGDGVGCE